MANTVLHATLFKPSEYLGIYIRPFEMLLSNQGPITSEQRLQFRYQRRVYTPLFFHVLSTTIAVSELVKITFKYRQSFLITLRILPAYE